MSSKVENVEQILPSIFAHYQTISEPTTKWVLDQLGIYKLTIGKTKSGRELPVFVADIRGLGAVDITQKKNGVLIVRRDSNKVVFNQIEVVVPDRVRVRPCGCAMPQDAQGGGDFNWITIDKDGNRVDNGGIYALTENLGPAAGVYPRIDKNTGWATYLVNEVVVFAPDVVGMRRPWKVDETTGLFILKNDQNYPLE